MSLRSESGSTALSRGDRSAPLSLSGFVITKNEAACIEACLRSLDLCSEIVVVDSGSTDDTIAIIQRLADEGLPIRLFHHAWMGYARQKQFALELCSQPWCISLDADERLDEDLREILPALLADDEADAWRVRLRQYLIGYGYPPSAAFARPKLRLVRRGAGSFDLSAKVHESIRVDGTVKTAAAGSLLHFRPLPLSEQILKENTYSTLKADQLAEGGRRPRLFRLVLNPPYYFLRLYVAHRLFLCGWPGFIHAMTGAFYSFLTEAKLWQHHASAKTPRSENAVTPCPSSAPGMSGSESG
jgi:glycosyltransferase involved in cell wall biosynthesis